MLPTDLSFHDSGLIVWMFEYGHALRWSGAKWEWAAGEVGSGYIQSFVVAPTGPGWQLCDGTVTDFLVVDPIPAAIPFTTPDETTNPVYHRSTTAYTGTVIAPTAPALTGSTGAPSAVVAVESNAPVTPVNVGTDTHTHPVGTLVAGTTGEPRHLDVLRWFRR
jgi:hypothetical protein